MRKTVITLSAMLAFAAAAANPVLAATQPARTPTPAQEQQYRQLQSAYQDTTAPYQALAGKFDSGALNWSQYLEEVAKLDQAAGILGNAAGQTLTIPESLTPPVHACTVDHKFAEWSVGIQYTKDDLARLGAAGPSGQPAPANIAGLVNRTTTQIESTLQASFAQTANRLDSTAIVSLASDEARAALLAKLKQQIAETYKLGITFDSRPLTIGDDPVCAPAAPPLPAP